MAEEKAKLPLLTNSQRNCFADCPRKHYLKYEQGYRPVRTSEALFFGSLFHAALEFYWRQYIKGPERTSEYNGIEQALIFLDSATDPANEFHIAAARALIKGYDKKYGQQKHDDVVGVEVEFRAPLLNPDTSAASRTFDLGGKIDVLKKISLVEHKTTTDNIDPGSPYWRQLAIDGQISGYYAGGMSLGYDIRECLYDVIKRPGFRPLKKNQRNKTDETPAEYEARCYADIEANPEKYFARKSVPRLEQDLVDYYFDMWAVARNIRESQLANRWPRNPRECLRFGACEFFDVCTGIIDINDESCYRKAKSTHEELSEIFQ